MTYCLVLVLVVSICYANQQVRYREANKNANRLQPLRRLFRDGVPEQDQHQNQVVSPPGTAPDYADPPSAPNFEGPFNGIASVTEAVREAEVTAFAHIVTRQAPATEAPREGEGAKPPSFFFELVRAIADLGHGVFSLLGLATGGT